jgi:hypothetical protein
MVLSLWWENRAEPWLRRNWHWLVVATGGLVLFIFAVAKRRPKVQVVSTELSGADQVKRELGEEKRDEEAKLLKDRDEELDEAKTLRTEELDALKREQEKRAKDPPKGDDLTDLLLKTGKDVRD